MISIVIPTLNEEASIGAVLSSLTRESDDVDIIVADGGSRDRTRCVVERFAHVRWVESEPGRGRQLNAGAAAARGDVLLFLHADTFLGHGWHSAIRRAAADPAFALGAFRFRLGQPGRAYRVVEWGVGWRCRLFDLPYGDQALFVRAEDFRTVDGFREFPIMEDVDFVHRMRRRGTVVIAPVDAYTSARRWVQSGMARQTWRNWSTYVLYRLGRPVDRLDRRYRAVSRRIVVFCKYPEAGTVKTRLAAAIGDEEAARVYAAMVRGTLKTVDRLRSTAEVIIQFSPADAQPAFRRWLGPHRAYAPQCEGDLGKRMLTAFEEASAAGIWETLVIGTDCPGLTPAAIRRAFRLLGDHDVILGPSVDGGYYLIGARRPHPDLFREVEWSTRTVCDDTVAACERQGLSVARLEALRDIDTLEDLRACAGIRGPKSRRRKT